MDIRKKIAEKYMNEKPEIDVDEISDLVEKITIEGGKVKVEDKTLETPKPIVKNIENREVKIEIEGNKAVLREGNIKIDVEEKIEVKENEIRINNKVLNTPPSKVVEKVKGEIKEIKLETYKDKVVYRVKSIEKRRLFFIIPVKYEQEMRIDIETGKVVERKRPWWAIFAW